MKPRIWSAACVAMAFGMTAGMFAQDPQSAPPSSAQKSAKTITVSGCVTKAQQSPTGTTGATGAAGTNEAKFVLTNAALASKDTAGTAGAPATAIASEYKLDASDSKLTPHVGHKVEVTGTVAEPMGGEEKPAASAANAPTLKVDSVKMIAATCTPQ